MQMEIDDAQAKVAAFVRQARGGGENALADAQTPTWDVSEKVSARWQSLVLRSASLDRLIQTAQGRHGQTRRQPQAAPTSHWDRRKGRPLRGG